MDATELPQFKLQAHADLIQATLHGDLQAVTRAVAMGADTSNAADEQGRAPLAIAASRGDLHTLNRLLQLSAADAPARAQAGSRALLCAAQQGHEAVVRLLLLWDSSDVKLIRMSAREAAARGHMRVCAVLLKQLSALDSAACEVELSHLQQDPTTAQQLGSAILEAWVDELQDLPQQQAELQQRRQLVLQQEHSSEQLLCRVAALARPQPARPQLQ